ncbi:MAG TPA: hypothetical protein VGJ63_04215 [Micromonosporaceae bacterium]|jgi:hypothetical protein
MREPEPQENDQPDEPDEPDQAPPSNRAERRAHGKRSGRPSEVTKVQPTGRRNPVQPRQWANRRAG